MNGAAPNPASARHPWAEERVLVSGATGFIGGHLCRALRERGAAVVALTRDPRRASALETLGCELRRADLCTPSTLQGAAVGCTLVVHAAAWVGSKADLHAIHATNVEGTGNLLAIARDARVRRFVHISSCAVYGSLQRMGITEDTPTRMTGRPYHDSKVEAEALVLAASSGPGPASVIARPSQVYGLDSPHFTLRPVEALRAGKLVLIDRGRHMCKPIYIDDLVEALLLCAIVPGIEGQSFNLSQGDPVPWREFFGAYADMLGTPKIPSLPYPLALAGAALLELFGALRGRPTTIDRDVIRSMRSDNSFANDRARRTLGWEPRVDLREGMRRTEAHLRTLGKI